MGARTAFLDALGLNPSLTAVREELLKIDDLLAVPTFSEADAKAMLRLIPDHAFANYLLGRARLDRGAYGQAEDLFKRSLEKKTNVPAAVGLAALWIEQSASKPKGENEKVKLAQAESLLRAALKQEETNAFARQTLIKLLISKGASDEAYQLIQPLLKAQPDDIDLRLTYIRIRMQQGKLEEASQLVSDLLDKEYKLSPPAQARLRLLAKQLSEAITQ
jgi:tetratricopeptide (TPR) repeat protein